MPRLLYVLALFLVLSPAVWAQVALEEAFPALPTFERPVDIQRAPGGQRLFVVEQSGLIVSFDGEANASVVDTVLDLRGRVFAQGAWPGATWEEGMLGLAFHPDYEENGHFFVYYNAPPEGDEPHTSRIARFTMESGEPPVADDSSELVLLDIPQPSGWHNGGQIAFHPDEEAANLYIALGDGGGIRDPLDHAQNRTTLFGSILRIDVDNPAGGLNYGIPPDNPFVGNEEGWREEIWAYGLRNPWRFSFDPATGHLWVGDVGQGTHEEVTVIEEGGENLGWDVVEGRHCYEDEELCDDSEFLESLLDPIYIYWHNSQGNYSISGGHVYHGSDVPELAGQYVFGDFMSGRVWALDYEGRDEPVATELGQLTHVSAFGVDARGELLIATFNEDLARGRLYRMVRSVSVEAGAVPREERLLRLVGPNPFGEGTRLQAALPEPGPVLVAVYDVLGREVAVLHDGPLPAGEHAFMLRADALAPGRYYVRLTSQRGYGVVPVTRVH